MLNTKMMPPQRLSRSTRVNVSASAMQTPVASFRASRRQLLSAGILLSSGLSSAPSFAAAGGDATQVGSYLPPAGVDDLVKYMPAKDKTPALRAGTISPETRYSFALPPGFREARISNTQNGNFCQPKCGEPWLEVVFEDASLGKIQLLATPLVKLTNKKDAQIQDLGSPEQVLPRLGPYITGTYFDEESDIVSTSSKKQDDGLTYYIYELNSLEATNGPHSLTAATAKGEVLYMLILSANDKQWAKSKSKFRTVLDTFRA